MGRLRLIFKNIVNFVVVALPMTAVACLSSCTSELDEEPPRYEKTSDYLLPDSETPTDEERRIVNEDVLEYLELFM